MTIAVAGLDLSLTQTGLAVIDRARVRHCYSFGETLKKDAGDAAKLYRLLRIARQIIALLERHDVERVGCESYAFSGKILTPLAEQSMLVRSQVYLKLKTVPVMMSADEARVFVFGSALRQKAAKVSRRKAMTKQAVMDGLQAKGLFEAKNPDEADALVVALAMDGYVNRRAEAVKQRQLEFFDRLDARCT